MTEKIKEALRYLGYGKHEPDEQVLEMVTSCFEELDKKAVPKSIAREFSLSTRNHCITIGGCLKTESRNLSKNLKDCDSVILFAATLGNEVDILLHKYSVLSPSRAVVMQAVAAAMLEEYCDSINTELKKEYQQKNRYLRPRFSPGYGDFLLECQTELAALLDIDRRIGIKLTDSLLMMPSKSVTAVIGVSDIKRECTVHGCETCSKTDCAYRR